MARPDPQRGRRAADDDAPAPRPSHPPNKRRAPPEPRRTLRDRLRVAGAALRRLAARARRPAWITLQLAIVVATIAGAVRLGQLGVEYATTAPAFAIDDVRVAGNHRVSEEAILEAGGLQRGTNIFTVDALDAAGRIEGLPWIAQAEVNRRLPRSVSVQVRERRAIALVAMGPLYLVGEDATVFKRVGPQDPIDLPVITGVDRARYLRDRTWASAVLLEAIALLHDYDAAGLGQRDALQEIHVEHDDGLSVFVGDDAVYVRLGHGPYRPKLTRLGAVLADLSRQGARPAYVYLDGRARPERVVVKLR